MKFGAFERKKMCFLARVQGILFLGRKKSEMK